jgi:hypothetical protein
MLEDGDIDMSLDVPIEDVAHDWWQSLSSSDYQITKKFY